MASSCHRVTILWKALRTETLIEEDELTRIMPHSVPVCVPEAIFHEPKSPVITWTTGLYESGGP